jgi:hypothetical protein
VNPSIVGPLTAEQLQAIWEGGTDSAYVDPYLAAGLGNGLEVHAQGFQQWARVSLAVDRTFQSMYVLPWSGQTNPSASGASQATCDVTFKRAGRMQDPLVLLAGLVWVDEQALDASPTGPVQVMTGRRYLLQETLVFFPGEQGPFDATVQAEKPGFSYNDPTPGTLNLLEQPGAGRNNVLGVLAVTPAPLPPAAQVPAQTVVLTGDDAPDMFTPDQLGQYVGFVAGANEGESGLVVGYYPPTSTAGSGVRLAQVCTVLLTATPSPGFQVGGATVVIRNGATVVGSGVVIAARATMGGYGVALLLTSGTAAPLPTWTITQPLSPTGTATGTIAFVHGAGQYVPEAPSGSPETGGSSWRMLSWATDWDLVASNAESPSGGALAVLDALGKEKDLPRLAGEVDGPYALRITRIADVVTPNAIKRCLVRNVGATGWCFREVGSPLLPGFFFDRQDQGGDCYDSGSLLFTGTYAGFGFVQGEPVRYIADYVNGGVDVVAEGFWGTQNTATPTANPAGYAPASYLAPTVGPAAGAGTFTFVLAPGRFSYPLPEIAVQASDRIVGMLSGTTFAPSAQLATVDGLRFHCLLSYEDMRAFFLAGVPALGLGEFGFAYDMPATYLGNNVVGAYDAVGWNDFYDGFPAGNAAYYQKLWNDVERTRVGGTSWEPYETFGQLCT